MNGLIVVCKVSSAALAKTKIANLFWMQVEFVEVTAQATFSALGHQALAV
ncbi:hypothetical protein [Marinomonas sp. 2405UD68-3]